MSDADLDKRTVRRDAHGRARLAAADKLRPLAPDGTLEDVRRAHNALLAKLKGRA